MVAKSSFKLLG